jgi:methionyl-tRNA formyltransferase
MRVVFMGSSEASATCLKALLRESSLNVVGIITQPDRPVGRGKALTACPCAQFASLNTDVDVIKPENINDEQSLEIVRKWQPDVIAVVAYGQFLSKKLLDMPKFGCINCHFSLLPKYRGASPVVAALAAGEKITGVTVMKMGVGMDSGPILKQCYEPIYADHTGGSLMEDLSITGAVALAKTLSQFASGDFPLSQNQDEAEATFAHKLKKTDGLIDWSEPTFIIERKIRAYYPWPGCFTFVPERLRKKGSTGRLAVLKAQYAKLEPGWAQKECGTLLKIDKFGITVKTLDTALLLTLVKPEGSSQMDAAAFARGRQLMALEDKFLQG